MKHSLSPEEYAEFRLRFGLRFTEAFRRWQRQGGGRPNLTDLATEISKHPQGKRVTSATVGRWAAGEAIPRFDAVPAVAEILGVRAGWLAFGEGPGPGEADRTDRVVAPQRIIELVWKALHALDLPTYENRATVARIARGELEDVGVIPWPEMADRMGAYLGRRVTAREAEVACMAQPADREVMLAVAHALHCDPDWLLDGVLGAPLPSDLTVPAERDSAM